eukprot:9641680-Ditylum_brightwellii.AAC.1
MSSRIRCSVRDPVVRSVCCSRSCSSSCSWGVPGSVALQTCLLALQHPLLDQCGDRGMHRDIVSVRPVEEA